MLFKLVIMVKLCLKILIQKMVSKERLLEILVMMVLKVVGLKVLLNLLKFDAEFSDAEFDDIILTSLAHQKKNLKH